MPWPRSADGVLPPMGDGRSALDPAAHMPADARGPNHSHALFRRTSVGAGLRDPQRRSGVHGPGEGDCTHRRDVRPVRSHGSNPRSVTEQGTYRLFARHLLSGHARDPDPALPNSRIRSAFQLPTWVLIWLCAELGDVVIMRCACFAAALAMGVGGVWGLVAFYKPGAHAQRAFETPAPRASVPALMCALAPGREQRATSLTSVRSRTSLSSPTLSPRPSSASRSLHSSSRAASSRPSRREAS